MEFVPSFATKQELDYLQAQMKNVYATQAEHADRLGRLEQRHDGDSRIKVAWGSQSPFSGLLNGTPQQDSSFNPAAEAFKSFDQDQASSMIGSLHLDTEEEPRRGASRANSVRFDESALHGHFGQSSRSANDFPPSRTSSAFGTHPLGERSLSHKSEGRQSSTHSARASSAGNESRPLSATVPAFVPNPLSSAPPPGLFVLGPVPAIIRCWLDTNYSNDSLLYAAVCTGSYKSIVSESIVERLGFIDQARVNQEGVRSIKLPVYLPEATIQQSSSRSASPAPQLPTLTTEFTIESIPTQTDCLHVYLGCDVLRFRNADIHFSLDRLTLFDDERNKVSVPLVRPENAALFQNLQTMPLQVSTKGEMKSPQFQSRDDELVGNKEAGDPQDSDRGVKIDASAERLKTPEVAASASFTNDDRGKAKVDANQLGIVATAGRLDTESGADEVLVNGTSPDTPSRSESGSIWGPWRKDSAPANRAEGTFAGAASASRYQRASRGRGMKVLKPARLSTSRTPSSSQPAAPEAQPVRTSEGQKTTLRSKDSASPATAEDRRSFSSESKSVSSSKPSSSNPIGGASAFGWLNSRQ